MATDFFERQTTARRNTKWLLVVFTLAVIAILVTTFVVTAVAVGASDVVADPLSPGGEFPWHIPVGATGVALALIGGGTAFKIAQLAGGGSGVAERLGGRRVYPDSLEPGERRLLNVVEEMALASGVPVPPVYLLKDEEGINAFAAGFSPSDAVIGVTRGCVEQLSRDELQGVIAHEFSHILNGDMRLNLRMIGILHGILLLGLVGRELLRIAGRAGGSRRRNDPVVYLLLVGLVMVILGFLGTLLGNLIKAAVSRQREFLADASAVQFTRNPEGIAGALKRIGAAVFGSRLVSPRAGECSHMYFAEGLAGLFATHPPLAERIRRLDPQWDGKYPPPLLAAAAPLAAKQMAGLVDGGALIRERSVPVEVVERASQQVAWPTEQHQQYAAQLIAAMPPAVVAAVREPYGARAVIYAMLLDENETIRAVQLKALDQFAPGDVAALTRKLLPEVDALDVRAFLPLVDMSMPALRAMSPGQYQAFSRCFVALVEADRRLGLFEWTLHQILLRHLRPNFERVRPPQIRYYGLQRLGGPCSVLLSTLARASQCDDEHAFACGARRLPEVPLRLLPKELCRLSDLHDALPTLTQVSARERGRLVDACAATICADNEVRVEEAELLRGICDMLDCPMPPLLPGQPVGRT